MKERPIIFDLDSIRAILDGRKTKTRRIVREPISNHSKILDQPMEHDPMVFHKGSWFKPNEWCPYGIVSDHLWVKETWSMPEFSSSDMRAGIFYRADGEMSPELIAYNKKVPSENVDQAFRWFDKGRKWHSSYFIPRWASRILLEITDVQMERLQGISVNDVNAEGTPYTLDPAMRPYGTRYEQFSRYWDSINAKRGYPWLSNPWVWVIKFKKVEE